jgi:hypothetical protein
MLHDNEAKKRLGYANKRSKVRPDGTEILYGNDWKQRKEELLARCGGRCEQITSDGERCRSEAHDPHHKVARSKGRDDRLSNLIALCRLHHDILDWKKLKWRSHEQSQPGPAVSL